MNLPNLEGEIEQKQKLLAQHRQNLSFLQNRAVQYGLDLPLSVHNALSKEKQAISLLERDLAALGISARPEPRWLAIVIEADDDWRKIVIRHIAQLGGSIIQRRTVPKADQQDLLESCTVAIIGAPPRHQLDSDDPDALNTKAILTLGRKVPLILLADWKNRDTAIILRQAARDYNIEVPPVTIFKENFDADWFSRIVHQILAR